MQGAGDQDLIFLIAVYLESISHFTNHCQVGSMNAIFTMTKMNISLFEEERHNAMTLPSVSTGHGNTTLED